MAKNNTRMLMKAGYRTYLLPEDTKLDSIKELVNSTGVSNRRGKYLPISSRDSVLGFEVIRAGDVLKFFVATDDEIIREVANKTQEKLEGKNHMSLLFEDGTYTIDGETQREYPDFADPRNDVDDFVEKLVSEVVSQ